MPARYEHDDIARIAYWSWLERGQPEGSPEVDWYYALSVVANPEQVQPTSVGNLTDAYSAQSGEHSMDEFVSHAVQGTDGEDIQDGAGREATRLGGDKSADRDAAAAATSPRTTRGGRRASDKSDRRQASNLS